MEYTVCLALTTIMLEPSPLLRQTFTDWDMQMVDSCNLELCVATLSVASSGVTTQK